MKSDIAKKAASLIERIEDLERVVLELERMRDARDFKISAVIVDQKHGAEEIDIEFKNGDLSTEIFQQNILDYTINNFNVELNEFRQELEEL